MCRRPEEAHARDRDRMMDIVFRCMDWERTASHWRELYEALGVRGNDDMHVLADDRTIVVYECESVEGHAASCDKISRHCATTPGRMTLLPRMALPQWDDPRRSKS